MEKYGNFNVTEKNKSLLDHDTNEVVHYMNLISQAMLTAGAEPDPIASIKTFLHELAKVFHADRAYVFEFNDDTADNTYVWCKDNVTPEINHLKHVPITAITAWMEAFNSGKGYMIDDMDKYQYANEEGHRILKA